MALRSRKSLERDGRSVPKIKRTKERDWDDKPEKEDAPAPVEVISVFDPAAAMIEHDEAMDVLRVLFTKGGDKIRWVACEGNTDYEVRHLNRIFEDEPEGVLRVEMLEDNLPVSDVGDTHQMAREILAMFKGKFLDRAMSAQPARYELVVVVSAQMQHDPYSGKMTIWYGVGLDPSVGAAR